MPFSRRNVEKLGISRPPPDAEPDDSGLGFLRDDIGSATTDGDFDVTEQPRTQSVLSLLSWGNDEFERQSTEEVQRMLEDMDRLLYEGFTSDSMSPLLADECRLWSKRFPHLRVVGHHLPVLPVRPPDRSVVHVAILTEDGLVDEESAACLRHPGLPEVICADGLDPDAAPSPTTATATAERPGGGGSAEAVSDPSALITEMVTNSLVSQLWADYVTTMTPVFQLGAESAEAMKLTSVSREASARARRHSDPGRAPPPPPPPPPQPPPQPPSPAAPRRSPAAAAAGAGAVGVGRQVGRKTGAAAAERRRSPAGRLPAVRPRGRATAAAAAAAAPESGTGHSLAASSRATLPRISPSTETTRQVAPQAWSRHQSRRDPGPAHRPEPAGVGRSKPQPPGHVWDSVSRSGGHLAFTWHR